MIFDESNKENHNQILNFSIVEKGAADDIQEECLYSTITPFKSKDKLFNINSFKNQNNSESCLQIKSKCYNDNNYNNDFPENPKRISFINTYNKDDYENPHDYYSIVADSFTQSERLNARSHSLNHLDNIKQNKAKHAMSYKNKFFSVNNKLRIKFKRLNPLKRPVLERVIRKNGEVNINRVHIARRHRKYISDLFNTVIGK